jgi:hypothetical protein
MKKFLLAILIAVSCLSFTAEARNPYAAPATVSVRGYTRSDGTYVRPHVRTAPDGIKSNNLSF